MACLSPCLRLDTFIKAIESLTWNSFLVGFPSKDWGREMKNTSNTIFFTILTSIFYCVSAFSAEGWKIDPIVLPGDVISDKEIVSISPYIDMDEQGNIAFIADYIDTNFPDPGNPGRGYFTQFRVVAVVGDEIEGVPITSIDEHPRSRPSISEDTVAYIATTPPNFTTLGVFKERSWVVKPGEQIDSEGDIAGRPFCCAPSINSVGVVAFNSGASATPNPGPFNNYNTDQATYSKPDSATASAVVRKYQTYAGKKLTQVREPVVSSSGSVVTTVSFENSGGNSSGALMLNQEFVVLPGDPIGTTGAYFSGPFSPASINASNEIAFSGLIDDAYYAVVTLDRIVAKQNAIVDSTTITSAGAAEISDAGNVAYIAGTSPGNQRVVFVEDDLVAKPGDMATGEIQLAEIKSTTLGFNNANQVAFTASFGSETGGLFVASPLNGNDSDGDEIVALFSVTKEYTDGLDEAVEVTLTCNAGLPLVQNFTLGGGNPLTVTFSVTNIPEAGADCEVTETGGPDNYTATMNGCAWTDVTTGLNTCEIINSPSPADYTVTAQWLIGEEGSTSENLDVDITITCTADILTVNSVVVAPSTEYSGTLGDGESVVVGVGTMTGDAQCSAIQEITQSGVEASASANCTDADLSAGGSASCTFTNTLFFEGIPSLSKVGLSLLVLLMMGVGFVGFRRFI